MSWKKTGRIFDPDEVKNRWWNVSHAMLTVPILLGEILRVYYSPRDDKSRSRTTFAEFDPGTLELTYVHTEPVLDIGPPGAFDDCGAMGSCILPYRAALYLFYIGWNVRTTVPWFTTTGLAVSYDGGYSFQKLPGPVLGRSLYNPFLTGSCWVLPWGEGWRMWHLSGLGWEEVKGLLEPLYDIRVANSEDLLDWRPSPIVCIPLQGDAGISVPSVLKWRGKWRMWYSYRGGKGYRTDPKTAYRIGYAESQDGDVWVRKDRPSSSLRCERSAKRSGQGPSSSSGQDSGPGPLTGKREAWESVMQCYPRVYEYGGKLHMLYNGNGFGKTGFGHAVWED